MNLLISDCCRGLHTGVGFGHPDNYRDPVGPFLIVEEEDPARTQMEADIFKYKRKSYIEIGEVFFWTATIMAEAVRRRHLQRCYYRLFGIPEQCRKD